MICRYCNSQIENSSDICMNCGCPAKFTLTIKRENQFFVVNPPIKVDIVSNTINCHIEINNGQIVPLRLIPDVYQVTASSGPRQATYTLDMSKDRILRLAWNRFSGKLELWELSSL